MLNSSLSDYSDENILSLQNILSSKHRNKRLQCWIDEKTFFDQPVKNDKTSEKLQVKEMALQLAAY